MQYRILILVAILGLNISACSRFDSELKTYMKCGIVAEQLEQKKASTIINQKVASLDSAKNLSARASYELSHEVAEELGLNDGNSSGFAIVLTLVKTYNSSECMEIHEQPKMKLGGFLGLLYYVLYFFV